MPNSWSPTSWKDYPYQQSPTYEDEAQLNKVVHQLEKMPPLVSNGEIRQLKHLIARAGEGKAFVLQGGDCAESFSSCRPEVINNKLKILLQMSLILIYGMRIPVIRVGRIAGQYAKPRSADFETKENVTLPVYRGDLVNSPEFTPSARKPNPKLLLQGYNCAAITLNYIRALLTGGFADLHYPRKWDLSFMEHSPQAEEFHTIVAAIENSLEFIQAIDGIKSSELSQVDFYTSHEALHLHYEQALTRQSKDNLWYNLSCHLPWVGMRTAQIDSAHVEFLSGINNPVGVKVGPTAQTDWLQALIKKLNPNSEKGRLVLISRLGASEIKSKLPALIQAAKATGIPVTWLCDPMHGNTETTEEGVKTRHFDNILSELLQAYQIHAAEGSHLGGVHFELTGENVTECLGGARGLSADDLKNAYHSLVDPRLNYEQSLEMAIQLCRAFGA